LEQPVSLGLPHGQQICLASAPVWSVAPGLGAQAFREGLDNDQDENLHRDGDLRLSRSES